MTSPMVDVRLRGVTKTYNGHAVLDAIDFEVEHGQFVVIFGRSGTGKSTLLNLIGCLDDATRGEIQILGTAIGQLNEAQRAGLRARKLGFVFQFFNLIPTLTARENIELPLAINRVPKSALRARSGDLLRELGLCHCANRLPDELSGGEQQRVAIARAIAHEPAIVLADEPTGNLDLDTGRTVLELLDQLCRSRGTTLIMATHSDEVVGRADRVITINNASLAEAPR